MNIFKKYSKLIDDSIKNSQYKQEKDNIEFKPVILSILPFLFINYFIFYLIIKSIFLYCYYLLFQEEYTLIIN